MVLAHECRGGPIAEEVWLRLPNPSTCQSAPGVGEAQIPTHKCALRWAPWVQVLPAWGPHFVECCSGPSVGKVRAGDEHPPLPSHTPSDPLRSRPCSPLLCVPPSPPPVCSATAPGRDGSISQPEWRCSSGPSPWWGIWPPPEAEQEAQGGRAGGLRLAC